MIRQLLLAGTVLLATPWLTAAQRTAPVLPPQHWTYRALARVEAHTPGVPIGDYAGNTLSALDAARRFRQLLDQDDPGVQAMAGAYLELLEQEMPGTVEEAKTAFLYRHGGVGYLAATGRAAPGRGFFREEDWTGAQPLDDIQTPAGMLAAALASPYLGAGITIQFADGEAGYTDSHLVAAYRRVAAWAGDRRLRFGPARSGFVVSNPTHFLGGGLYLREPVRLPGFLRHLGAVRLETFLSGMERNGRVDRPLFWAARGSIQPAGNLIIGINRASIFGGAQHPPNVKDVLEMLVGGYGGQEGEFENQVVSADARLVLQSTRQPLELYGEWAADDADGMWYKAPAITLGLQLPSLGGLRQAYAAVEGTVMYPKPRRSNTYWYRNVFFRAPWAMNDTTLIGHELGGHGRQLRLTVGVDEDYGRLRVEASGWLRDRGAENTFSPEREGGSVAGEVRAAWRFRRVEFTLAGAGERGGEWSSSSAELSARVRF